MSLLYALGAVKNYIWGITHISRVNSSARNAICTLSRSGAKIFCFGKELRMSSWERAYDVWKTTPPEMPESQCKCESCGQPLYPDEVFYRLDGEILCEECGKEWLDSYKEYVTSDMVAGEWE